MNQRIKQLRKELGMSLEVFSNYLGVSKSAISKIEIGTNHLSGQMINSIIKTNWMGKYVRREWLEHGKGNMFVEPHNMIETPLAIFVSKLISSYIELTEDEQMVVDKFIRSITKDS